MPANTMLTEDYNEKLGHTFDNAIRPQSSDLEESVVDSTEEKRLVRKLDRRILPITCILYLFACTCILYSVS